MTGFPIVPTMVAMLLKMRDLSGYDLSTLRYMTNTGAALPVQHIHEEVTYLGYPASGSNFFLAASGSCEHIQEFFVCRKYLVDSAAPLFLVRATKTYVPGVSTASYTNPFGDVIRLS